MQLGLVGKPSSGKSTFFKACTLANVAIAPYPFTTIKPNLGMAYVKITCIDTEFKTQCMPREGYCLHHWRFVPAQMLDVAGLVPGAHAGKGLGNQFLDDLRQADVFLHIVDLSGTTDSEGKPAEDHDVTKDVEFLEEELDLWFLGIMEKAWRAFARKAAAEKAPLHEAIVKQFSGLNVKENQVKETMLKSGLDANKVDRWTSEDLLKFVRILRKIAKPSIIVGNKCDHPKSADNLKKIKAAFPDAFIVPCSAEAELVLREASKEKLIEYIPGDDHFKMIDESRLNEKQLNALKFIEKNVLKVYGSTGVQDVLNKAVFDFLKYIAVFPAGANKLADSKGNILPDCFLVPEGTTALEFAFKLHTDLGKQFIRAINARTKQVVGKDYRLKHRDGIEIVT